MSNKRLLMCYHSSEYGGIEKQILDILKGLSSEIDIYVATKKGSLSDEYIKAGAKEVIDCYPSTELDIKYIQEIYKLIKSKQIDIVHAHELRTGVQAIFAAKLAGCSKRIYHVHTPFIFWVYKGIKKYVALIPNWFANFIVGNYFATHVLALTPYISRIRRDKELINDKKIVVIPNGVNRILKADELSLKLVSEKYHIPGSSFVIGYTARFSDEKGHESLIRAYASALHQLPESKLLLLSDGDGLEHMKDLSKELGIGKNVIFTGRVSDQDKFTILQRMNIFVFPTKAEGFGISLLEAMMLGIPSIVSDLPVLHDLAEDSVIYFDITKLEQLSDKLVELSKNTDLQKTLSARSKLISERYSMEMFISNYKKLYLS